MLAKFEMRYFYVALFCEIFFGALVALSLFLRVPIDSLWLFVLIGGSFLVTNQVSTTMGFSNLASWEKAKPHWALLFCLLGDVLSLIAALLLILIASQGGSGGVNDVAGIGAIAIIRGFTFLLGFIGFVLYITGFSNVSRGLKNM